MNGTLSPRPCTAVACLLVASAVLATGCESPTENVVRANIDEIWNAGNLGRIDERYSATMAAQLKEQVESTRVFYPDINFSIRLIAIDGDLFFCRWRMTGTHSKYRKRVELHGVTYGRTDDGIIVDEQIIYDRLEEADQLGFMVRSPAEL